MRLPDRRAAAQGHRLDAKAQGAPETSNIPIVQGTGDAGPRHPSRAPPGDRRGLDVSIEGTIVADGRLSSSDPHGLVAGAGDSRLTNGTDV